MSCWYYYQFHRLQQTETNKHMKDVKQKAVTMLMRILLTCVVSSRSLSMRLCFSSVKRFRKPSRERPMACDDEIFIVKRSALAAATIRQAIDGNVQDIYMYTKDTFAITDLNHYLNHSKNYFFQSFIYDFLFLSFLIDDLYEFNTSNCLQASRSTKFCVCFSYSLSECSEATQTCLQEEVSFQVRSSELKST